MGISFAVPTIPVFRTALAPLIGVDEAHAQQKKKRKTLFDILFKKRKKKKNKVTVRKTKPSIQKVKKAKPTVRKKKKQVTTSRKTKPVVRKASTKKRRVTQPVKPKVIAVKNENALKVLVVGDFLAGGMARELEKLYADNANLLIINKSNPSSGLVREDVVNWPEALPSLVEEYKPAAIITLVGMNDRQKLWNVKGSPAKLSAQWVEEYTARVSKLTSTAVTNKIPLVWVGLPPVRSGKMNADYLIFNEFYRSKVEASNSGEYVDIWNGFTNEEGKFVSAGPDINGQIVRLRGSKGINMTRAGRAKLAFFADKALQKIGITGNAQGFNYAAFGTINPNIAQPNVPQYDPVGSGKTVVIPLGTPALDGGIELEGEKDVLAAKNSKDSLSFDLVEKGQISLPRSGRVDASWGKPKPDAPVVEPVEVKKPKTEGKKTSSVSGDDKPRLKASTQATSQPTTTISN